MLLLQCYNLPNCFPVLRSDDGGEYALLEDNQIWGYLGFGYTIHSNPSSG